MIEKLLDQAVLQLQVVFVNDPAQAADQPQAVGVGFVIEDEILGERGLEKRHRQQVLGQLAQGAGFQQRIRTTQAELVAGQCRRRHLGFVQQPAKTTGHPGHQNQADQQRRPAPGRLAGSCRDGRRSSVITHVHKTRSSSVVRDA
ncbi:TPA: hypothetical protein ACKP2V_000452 [Pseudomonas putida]